MPEVSVIVPVRNGANSIRALLDSLDAQTLDRDRFEVIVVDNGSSDGTAEVAAAHGARVVSEPVAGRARARNLGAATARARLHACTDADCVAEPAWLEALLACSGAAPVVAGEVRTRVGSPPNSLERFEALWRFAQGEWVKQGWAATANLLISREAFERIGGFDTAYRHYSEDADFCLRAGRAGLELGYCANAVVEHPAERELWPFLRRSFMHGYGANQAYYRLGAGYRAWREPGPVLIGDQALERFGHSPDGFDRGEWRRMARLARIAYGARVVGSVWAELARAR